MVSLKFSYDVLYVSQHDPECNSVIKILVTL